MVAGKDGYRMDMKITVSQGANGFNIWLWPFLRAIQLSACHSPERVSGRGGDRFYWVICRRCCFLGGRGRGQDEVWGKMR